MPSTRVCSSCGLGLLLETRKENIPLASDAFLVVDRALRVQAMSVEAEELLAIDEDLAINRPVTELLVPADAEPRRRSSLAAAITSAVASGHTMTAHVRPWNTYGIRMQATIAGCGPPRAALLVLGGAAVQLPNARA